MRKFALLFVLLAVLLTACGQAAASPTAAPTVAPTAAGEQPAAQATDDPNFVCAPEQLFPEPRAFEAVRLAPISADDHVVGPEDARLTLIEYSDFQCPYCGLAEDEMNKLLEKYPDDVRLVFRHFPLNIHDKANLAAQATEAAGMQDKFWEMYHAIFAAAREQVWTEMTVADFETWLVDQAGQVGLDADQFKTDLNSADAKARVEADRAEAEAAGLGGTPSFYVVVDGQVLFVPEDQLSWDAQTMEAVLKLTSVSDKQYAECPPQVVDASKSYTATIKTDKGDIVIRLLPDKAPVTVNSFVFLAREGFYDGVTFHRVLPGFVAQAGDPSGTGFGGPGYRFKDEVDPEFAFDREGIVAMAKSGPNSNGSQFFITLAEAANLNGGYTVFGEVIEGMDVVKQITPRDPDSGPDLPAGDQIISITITEE